MAGKAKTKRNGQNILLNARKRLEAAKRKGKSAAYIKDLEAHLSKCR